MSKKAEFVTLMETQMKKWDTEVDALAARGEKVSAEMRAAYHDEVRKLRADRDAAQKKFKEFRDASESAGAQMQAGMQGAWDTMQKALVKASAHLTK